MSTRQRLATLFIIAVAAVALLSLAVATCWRRIQWRLLDWLCEHPFVIPAIKLLSVLIPAVLLAAFVSISLSVTHEEAAKYAPVRNAREERPKRDDGIPPINWHLADEEVSMPLFSEERYGADHGDFFALWLKWLPNTSEPQPGSCRTQEECSALTVYGSEPGQINPLTTRLP